MLTVYKSDLIVSVYVLVRLSVRMQDTWKLHEVDVVLGDATTNTFASFEIIKLFEHVD